MALIACGLVGLLVGWCVGWSQGAEFVRKRWMRERCHYIAQEHRERWAREREKRLAAECPKVVPMDRSRRRRKA